VVRGLGRTGTRLQIHNSKTSPRSTHRNRRGPLNASLGTHRVQGLIRGIANLYPFVRNKEPCCATVSCMHACKDCPASKARLIMAATPQRMALALGPWPAAVPSPSCLQVRNACMSMSCALRARPERHQRQGEMPWADACVARPAGRGQPRRPGPGLTGAGRKRSH